jgi:Ran GTPase-activating protein (RanGAP) involved in mRNA processing and transport
MNINTFPDFLSTVPSEDLTRTWPANRTIMLRMTSKQIKNIIDNKYLPTVIYLKYIKPVNIKFAMIQLPSLVTTCQITCLDLPDIDMKKRFEKFKKILTKCKLNKLNLYNNNLGDKEIESISEILMKNGQCSVLHLAHNKITEIGLKSLLKLSNNKNINIRQSIDLNLCNNNIGYEYEYENERVNNIELFSTLSNLNLCYNKINDIDIDKILFNNKDLKSLDFSQNRITTFNFNTNNTTFILENLNLSYNHITILGAKNLSKILEKCTMLKSLNLSYNFICTEGATNIIEKCLSLNSIYLGSNMIADDGMEKLTQLLIQRTSITYLTINGNNIGIDILNNLNKVLGDRVKLIY